MRIVVTRPGHQADKISAELMSLGATAIHIPVTRVVPSDNAVLIDDTIKSLSSFDWVVFTSANGVKYFVDSIKDPATLALLRSRRLAAVGPATSEMLEKLVRKPNVMPAEFVSDELMSVMGVVTDKKILLAQARKARKVLANTLRENGAIVTELALYDVVINLDSELDEFVRNLEQPDFITFTSSSTVHAFFELLKRTNQNWLETVPVVCIGPITAKTLRDYGIEPYKVATVYTVDGIIDALSN